MVSNEKERGMAANGSGCASLGSSPVNVNAHGDFAGILELNSHNRDDVVGMRPICRIYLF